MTRNRNKNNLIHMIRRENCVRVYTFCHNSVRMDKGTLDLEKCTCERCRTEYKRLMEVKKSHEMGRS